MPGLCASRASILLTRPPGSRSGPAVKGQKERSPRAFSLARVPQAPVAGPKPGPSPGLRGGPARSCSPPHGPLENYPGPASSSASETAAENEAPVFPQTRDPAGGSPARPGRAETFFSLGRSRRWPHAGSPRSPPAPAGRLEAAPPPAELGARTGGSPGTAGPARLQAVGEAGGRAPRGPEPTGPRPGSATAEMGASRSGAEPCGSSFSFGGRGRA